MAHHVSIKIFKYIYALIHYFVSTLNHDIFNDACIYPSLVTFGF